MITLSLPGYYKRGVLDKDIEQAWRDGHDFILTDTRGRRTHCSIRDMGLIRSYYGDLTLGDKILVEFSHPSGEKREAFL